MAFQSPEEIRFDQLSADYDRAAKVAAPLRVALAEAESTLAATTAQYDEACKAGVLGQKSDPSIYRASMDALGHRIHGLRQALIEAEEKLAPISTELQAAAAARQRGIDDETERTHRAELLALQAEVSNAQLALEVALERAHRKNLALQSFRTQRDIREAANYRQQAAARQS